MAKIESLRNYPVAGMEGYDVEQLIITPEAIVGNRSFALVLESQIDTFIEKSQTEDFENNPDIIPLRLTQTGCPKLTLFSTENRNGKLVISYNGEEFEINQSIEVEEPTKDFYSGQDAVADSNQVLQQKALPFRVSKRSKSKRWAEDCGDDVAKWLSDEKRIGKKVRLVKAVQHPEEKKHHFTWYTDLHFLTQASLVQLAVDAGAEVDELTMRYNGVLTETDQAYDEKNWEKVILGGVEAIVKECERCCYIGIDRVTGVLAQHMQVLNEVVKQHDKNFGIYIEPTVEGTFTIRVDDEITVIEKII